MSEPSPAANRRVYPLSVLFVVTAGCALVAAMLTPLMRALGKGDVGAVDAGMVAVWGCQFGMMVGGIVGVYHYRRSRGLVWGILIGGVIGTLLGPLALIPADAAPSLFSLSLVGSIVIVLAAASFRLSARASS